MRRFLPFLIIAVLGIAYLWQKNKEQQSSAGAKTEQTISHEPELRQVSEHNWAKHSIDRARDMAQKARAQTDESQRQ